MPRGDGTGPTGGNGQGQGRGQMGFTFAAGTGGNCICPKCKKTVPHITGQSCNQMTCPQCGEQMTRQQ